MSVSYEVDLKEVLGQINQKLDRNEEKLDRIQRDFDQKLDGMQRDFTQRLDRMQQHVDQKLDTLQKDVTDLKVGVSRLEERVHSLEDKVEGLSKRIDSQEFVSRSVFLGLIVAILGGLAKLFGFAGNP